jgi:hypothetical protein
MLLSPQRTAQAASSQAQPAPPALPSIVLSVQGDTLHGSNLTPGKTVWVLGLTRDVVLYQPQMGHIEAAYPVAADGSFTLKMKSLAPLASMWLLVDMATGRYTMSSPPGFSPRRVAYSGNALKSNGLGEVKHIETYLSVAEVVLIRPGTGGWTMSAVDGGPRDDDHKADSRTQFLSDAMTRIGDSPEPPKKIEKGDIVFVLDPRELTWFVIEVGK